MWSTEVDKYKHTCLIIEIAELMLWKKGFFIIISHLGETVWDRLVRMFTVLIDRTLLSCQRVSECSIFRHIFWKKIVNKHWFEIVSGNTKSGI
jgi:hypothetical protein